MVARASRGSGGTDQPRGDHYDGGRGDADGRGDDERTPHPRPPGAVEGGGCREPVDREGGEERRAVRRREVSFPGGSGITMRLPWIHLR